ncbi:homeobox protein MSX-2-like [Tachypleus tridentatus]|uniref:homeobox protein MSX-2-like n=1 Tax=Tachypleus tridentatus TaxID=6853 RepID=UPI003FD09D92
METDRVTSQQLAISRCYEHPDPQCLPQSKKKDFSIESILSGDNAKQSFTPSEVTFRTKDLKESVPFEDINEPLSQRFAWLQCSRYKPPKLTRRRDPAKRRQLGRSPRIPFTTAQVSILEHKFQRTHYLSGLEVTELSQILGLTETRVKIWFQNRRARERRETHGVGAPLPAPPHAPCNWNVQATQPPKPFVVGSPLVYLNLVPSVAKRWETSTGKSVASLKAWNGVWPCY